MKTRVYWYCEFNGSVYTTIEMYNSKLPSERFENVGTFKNRTEAETLLKKCGYEVTRQRRL